MSAVAEKLEEFCPSCGEWVSYLLFDHDYGWCIDCRGEEMGDRCTFCQKELPPNHGRTMCHACRRERWLVKHIDELEYLIVAKGYTLHQATVAIVKMIRPVCKACKKPIPGGREDTLFHKGKANSTCRAMYNRYARLRKQGLTTSEALARLNLR